MRLIAGSDPCRGDTLTTTSAPDVTRTAEVRPGEVSREVRRAARRLLHGRLTPKPGISKSQVRAALARALAGTAPRSSHARLLATALAPAAQAPRPPAEVAVRVLLARAQVPTAAAVAGQLVAIDHHRAAVTAREQRRQARRAPESSEAARAATLVAEHWQAHGHGPTWRALGRAMGWPPLEVASSIRGLAGLGWLTLGEEPRSLRPGPLLAPSPNLVGRAASRTAGRSSAPTGEYLSAQVLLDQT